MAFFKPIYKKMSKKWHPQAVSVGKPIEMDELCKQIALISTVSSADSKADCPLARRSWHKVRILALPEWYLTDGSGPPGRRPSSPST